MVYRHFPMATGEGSLINQPIAFSHQHHVQGAGLDCRYCHTSVEKSSSAGFPDTGTCYGCHSQIWNKAPILEPVRKSAKENKPLQWFRVHRIPDYVFFDHSIHISKGIGCVSCHGAISTMKVVVQKRSFLMRDCLGCHQNPEKFVRPVSQIFNENWTAQDQNTLGKELIKKYHINAPPKTNCNACHR
ncbi:MAG: cytochrome c3 family protein [Bdellovibrio sp.]